jgi:hypothetical protein
LTFHDLFAVGVDEGSYLRDWRSSSAPKKVAARFKISFARRNSRFSCSRSAILLASTVVVPGAFPSSTSAWLTQDRTDST